MDVERFDLLTRMLATNTSRRLALAGLALPTLLAFGSPDAACAGDIKEACLEDICGFAQGCGRIAV